jgi:hypothetical protein
LETELIEPQPLGDVLHDDALPDKESHNYSEYDTIEKE